MTDQQISIDIIGIARRRARGFILISAPLFIIAVITAFLLPPVYLSKTTILIEGQQIPDEYVRTAVTAFVEERLEIIKQQVLSRTRLEEIIKENNLYPDMRKRHTWEEIVEKMRRDIHIKTISADMASKGSGSATIAFTLSYEGRHPGVVQKVANILASLYMEENVRSREQRAAITTQYLTDELEHVKEEINNLDSQIASLKMSHMGELPEFSSVNLQSLERLSRDLDQIDMQIKSLQERKVYLEGQLSMMQSQRALDADGGMIVDPRQHLETLKLKLLSLQADLSDKHPDVIRLKKEIKQFEDRLQNRDSASSTEARRLKELRAELAKLKADFGSNHPDVIRKEKEIKVLVDAQKAGTGVPAGPVSLAEANLMTQIDATIMEMANLTTEKAQVKQRIQIYQGRIEKSPLVEREYANLLRDYQHATSRYNEIMGRLSEAKAAQSLEETRRSERFTIVEPAQLPGKPYKPDRIAIILVGFVLAAGAGAGFAGLRESLDHSIKSAEELAALSGLPILSTLPKIKTEQELQTRRVKIIILVAAAVVILVGLLLAVHLLVMPLDILWIKIQRRLA